MRKYIDLDDALDLLHALHLAADDEYNAGVYDCIDVLEEMEAINLDIE